MTYIEKLNDDERSLLIALPYRVGLWISESDQTGGEEADAYERQALESILYGFAEDYCKSEFVEEIMKQTIAHRDKWEKWGENLDRVPDEVRKAVLITQGRMPQNDVLSLRVTLQQIAHAIAAAFREIDPEPSFSVRAGIFCRYAVARVKSVMKKQAPRPLEDFYNISKAEDAALAELDRALGLK